MLSTILTSLQQWVGTPTGLMTLAIIFTLGIIIAFFMLVVVNNSRSELKIVQERSKHDIESLQVSLESQKIQFETESRRFAETTTSLEKSNQSLRSDIEDLQGTLSMKHEEVLTLEDEVGTQRLTIIGLGKLEALMSRTLFGFGRMVVTALTSKVCEVRTYVVTGGIDCKGVQHNFFNNVTHAVKGLKPNLNWNELNLEYVMQLNRDDAQNDDSLLPIQKAVNNIYHENLLEFNTISPVYRLSVLYIRSLDIKIVLTDFGIDSDIQVNEPELLEAHRTLRESILAHVGTVIRKSNNIIVLSPEAATSMGSPFEGVEFFNDEWVNSVKSYPTTQAA